jgi:hypothetical protein
VPFVFSRLLSGLSSSDQQLVAHGARVGVARLVGEADRALAGGPRTEGPSKGTSVDELSKQLLQKYCAQLTRRTSPSHERFSTTQKIERVRS